MTAQKRHRNARRGPNKTKEAGHPNPFFEAAGSCSWLCWLYRFEFRGYAIGGDAFSTERPVCDISGGPSFDDRAF